VIPEVEAPPQMDKQMLKSLLEEVFRENKDQWFTQPTKNLEKQMEEKMDLITKQISNFK